MTPVAVLDIPLLFETGGERALRCGARGDGAIAMCSGERVLARPGMTEETFRAILAKQMPDAEKRARAHFLVDTGRGFDSAEAQVRSILACSRRPAGTAYTDCRDECSTMLREIVLDTETTGTDHAKGDRVIEIGCVEILNHIPTGQDLSRLHQPGIPGRSPAPSRCTAFATSFSPTSRSSLLSPTSSSDFIGDGRLVIHNAAFDIGFLNAEFARTGHPAFSPRRGGRHARAGPAQASGRARTTSMRSARATASTIPSAPSTARCSTRRSWPRSISS